MARYSMEIDVGSFLLRLCMRSGRSSVEICAFQVLRSRLTHLLARMAASGIYDASDVLVLSLKTEASLAGSLQRWFTRLLIPLIIYYSGQVFTCKSSPCVSKESFVAMQVRYTARLLLSVLFATLCFSQSTSLFCNRLYHSIVVANDRLYVDGGEIRTVCTH